LTLSSDFYSVGTTTYRIIENIIWKSEI
jgi:hypothetical protein